MSENMQITREMFPKYIDHTLLKANATLTEVGQLCEEALQYGFYSVCVYSSWVAECVNLLKGSEVKVSAVCGFPSGAEASRIKAAEAAYCIEQGASEIDMVLPIGLLIEGQYARVIHDIEQVVQGAGKQAIVKVILETGYLNEQQIIKGCQCVEQAGAHFVKTSTGFGPRGASLEDIYLMKKTVSNAIGIKASGGIRTLDTALKMIEAGATRIGTSSGVAIMKGIELADNTPY